MKRRIFPMMLICLLLTVPVLSSCQAQETLVIYVSVDQNISQPVVEAFAKETGIKVEPVYDVEATKTTGLTNRLIAEASAPKADLFWSGEAAQTEMLSQQGILEKEYTSFGGRARILFVNTDLVPEADYPDSIYDLVDNPYPVVFGNPVFGTTSTHAAALYFTLGEDAARDYYQGLKDSVTVVDGNSMVRDMVVAGEAAIGITDTDDAHSAVQAGKPVKVIYPDQHAGDLGTFVIPNTVAMVTGAKNTENARKFVEYLTSDAVMQGFADVGWFLPLNDLSQVTSMDINFYELEPVVEQVRVEMTEMFIE